MNELSLFSRGESNQSRRGIIRQLDTGLQVVAAQAELAQTKEIAEASIILVALHNLEVLATTAEPIARTHPAFANEAISLVRAYTARASLRTNGH
jgi:hypothetical protein